MRSVKARRRAASLLSGSVLLIHAQKQCPPMPYAELFACCRRLPRAQKNNMIMPVHCRAERYRKKNIGHNTCSAVRACRVRLSQKRQPFVCLSKYVRSRLPPPRRLVFKNARLPAFSNARAQKQQRNAKSVKRRPSSHSVRKPFPRKIKRETECLLSL